VSASEAGVPWTYTANNLNQYTSATENNVQLDFTYDLDGSMTYRPVDAATGWTQVWNGENRMIETWKGDDRLEFKYDYMGRRVEKKVYDGQTLTTHLKFVYDGFKLVEEHDGADNNTPLRRYTWQPDDVGLDVVLQMTDVPNAAHSFHLHDANKNVMQIMDETGFVTAGYAYSPFGNAIEGLPSAFGFSSEYYDNHTNLLSYNYRYFFSDAGCWLSQDPIIVHQNDSIYLTSGLYNFTNNNPINNIDILGLITEKISAKFVDNFAYQWVGRRPTKTGWVDIYRKVPVVKEVEIEYEYEKYCETPTTPIIIAPSITSKNVKWSLDQKGISIFIIGYTESYNAAVVNTTTNKPCPNGKPGSILTVTANFELTKSITFGLNPGIGWFSFDLGFNFIFSEEKLLCYQKVFIQECCCE
jgi:RHS repeat-associated protein